MQCISYECYTVVLSSLCKMHSRSYPFARILREPLICQIWFLLKKRILEMWYLYYYGGESTITIFLSCCILLDVSVIPPPSSPKYAPSLLGARFKKM